MSKSSDPQEEYATNIQISEYGWIISWFVLLVIWDINDL